MITHNQLKCFVDNSNVRRIEIRVLDKGKDV
jgi:hypothetical protein